MDNADRLCFVSAMPKASKKPAKKKPARPKSKALVPASKRAKKRDVTLTPGQAMQGAAAGGLAIAAAAHPGVAPFALLFGAMGVALALAHTLSLDALRPAARAFGARLASRVAPDAPNERSAALALRNRVASDPSVQRAILDGTRRLLDSISEEAAEPLAELTAEYANAGRAPDGFFRGAARLLSELTSEELATAREIIGRAGSILDERDEVSFMYRQLFEDGERVGPYHLKYVRPLPLDDPRRPTTVTEWADLGDMAGHADRDVYRVIQQLKLSGLADDPPSGGFSGISGKENFVLPTATVRRIARIMGIRVR